MWCQIANFWLFFNSFSIKDIQLLRLWAIWQERRNWRGFLGTPPDFRQKLLLVNNLEGSQRIANMCENGDC